MCGRVVSRVELDYKQFELKRVVAWVYRLRLPHRAQTFYIALAMLDEDLSSKDRPL